MKKIALIAAAAGCLFTAALNCSASQEVAPPVLLPDGKVLFQVPAAGDNAFVGHYGEVLSYDERWTAEPEMQGLMEVVRFHAQTRGRDKSGSLTFAPYRPKPEDYVPQNFAPMELAQLFVIPKNAPNGFSSLRKLRAAKGKELAASGVGFTIRPPGSNDLEWPPDTFFVSISTPYHLFQQYTQSDKNIFIFTAGSDPLDRIQGPIGKISNSLRENLEQFQRQLSEDYRVDRDPFVAIPWVLIVVISSALGLFPKSAGWRGRLRLIGRATLGFSSVLPIMGLPILYWGWRYGQERWVNRGSIELCLTLAMPWVCTALSAWLGGRRLWRVFLWTAGIVALPAAVAYFGALDFAQGRSVIAMSIQFGAMSWELMALGLLCGVCFGLTHADSGTKAATDRHFR